MIAGSLAAATLRLRQMAAAASQGSSGVAAAARTRFVEAVQRVIDLREETLDFVTLVRAGILPQPLQEVLLLREKSCESRHLKPASVALDPNVSPTIVPVGPTGPRGTAVDPPFGSSH